MLQGVYVLLDSRFKLLTQISNTKQYMELAPKVPHFISEFPVFDIRIG